MPAAAAVVEVYPPIVFKLILLSMLSIGRHPANAAWFIDNQVGCCLWPKAYPELSAHARSPRR